MIEIRPRGEILLVGGAGALSGLPAPLRQRSVSASAVQRLSGDTQGIHHLRPFWLRRSHPRSIGLASDRDLPALPRAGIATVRPAVAGAPPPSPVPSPSHPRAASPALRTVNRMTLEERLTEMLRRAAGRLPRAMGEELLSLVTPESIAIMFGLGGLVAVRALGDLVTCFARIFDAQSDRDLDESAEALARAASAIRVMGLAAILHEEASSRGRGSAGRRGGPRREAEPPERGARRRSSPGTGDSAKIAGRLDEQQGSSPVLPSARREGHNLIWEKLVAKKAKARLSGGEFYREIIESSQKSRADVDSKLGIVRKEP